MTILTAFKNTFAFALSFGVVPWLERDAFLKVAGWNTLIEGLIFLTTIPMYMFGARLRKWTSQFEV
ncbi:uncharacterized protein Z518_00143 [Rhinocladiella mackenziei CBS 650.93]|uniref:Uncharacterized protein n=1 Tax=Rhinocladiella mackenziei CBS 650.93 TaxID=1442369 RepID=A0A0D2JI77_9EURO|nr:uncharacterized protein Z518_00143 [Rhinocladiella mackenziei CBS 650.93]KIX09065.1 hypothetical protein Z518_00143 [Rhinocladiella mackenziei CBS 650.93]